MSKMKKFFFLFLMLLTLSSTSFSKNTEVMQADKPNLTVSADNEKKITITKKSGLCLAIFEISCGSVFLFMDCSDMECVTNYGWSQLWNGFNFTYCSSNGLNAQTF